MQIDPYFEKEHRYYKRRVCTRFILNPGFRSLKQGLPRHLQATHIKGGLLLAVTALPQGHSQPHCVCQASNVASANTFFSLRPEQVVLKQGPRE